MGHLVPHFLVAVERLRENLDFAEKLSEIEKFVPGRDL